MYAFCIPFSHRQTFTENMYKIYLKRLLLTVGFDANENWDGFIRLSLEELFLMR